MKSHKGINKRLHKIAVKWLMDRANPEQEGGLGVFADTRFCTDLTRLLKRVERSTARRVRQELSDNRALAESLGAYK